MLDFWGWVQTGLSFIAGVLLSQIAEIFLPERVRIWFALKKKLLSKWLRNPSYTIGITSRLDYKEALDLETVQARLRDLYSMRSPTARGTELHFQESVGKIQINTKIQPAYEEDKQQNVL